MNTNASLTQESTCAIEHNLLLIQNYAQNPVTRKTLYDHELRKMSDKINLLIGIWVTIGLLALIVNFVLHHNHVDLIQQSIKTGDYLAVGISITFVGIFTYSLIVFMKVRKQAIKRNHLSPSTNDYLKNYEEKLFEEATEIELSKINFWQHSYPNIKPSIDRINEFRKGDLLKVDYLQIEHYIMSTKTLTRKCFIDCLRSRSK